MLTKVHITCVDSLCKHCCQQRPLNGCKLVTHLRGNLDDAEDLVDPRTELTDPERCIADLIESVYDGTLLSSPNLTFKILKTGL
jgi:hypothetical protein